MTIEHAPDALTRRLLKSLSARGVWLEQTEPGVAMAVRYRLMSPTGTPAKADAGISSEVVSTAARKGWLLLGEGRATLTAEGARSLRRALAGGRGGDPRRNEGQRRRQAATARFRARPGPCGAARSVWSDWKARAGWTDSGFQ